MSSGSFVQLYAPGPKTVPEYSKFSKILVNDNDEESNRNLKFFRTVSSEESEHTPTREGI